MNKKVVLQIGCFIVMWALEMIAVRFDPSSAAFTALLILSVLMIPAFVLVKYIPMASETEAEVEAELETPLPKAA